MGYKMCLSEKGRGDKGIYSSDGKLATLLILIELDTIYKENVTN